jgi:serine phosphatase RsbU (regulator of sigma subunit)
VNDALLRNFRGSQFCTLALGMVESRGSSARLVLTLGGHPSPLILRAGGEVEAVGAAGSLLGVVPVPELHEVEATMEPGDTLLLYTDGATETKTRRGRLGSDGLARILGRCAGQNAMEVVTGVENAVALRQEGDEADDLALLAVRFVNGV